MAENKSVQGDCCGCVYRDGKERCRRFPPSIVMFAHRDADWRCGEFGFPRRVNAVVSTSQTQR